ncbi:MAG: glycosyltransferase family 9 protein [Candidatus Tectomicrobia bacterium]|uniref:Glycosyltransferase family 9 protein n=1 Tax=Tectimicrobiota bacterium TaxID=2528274 RepID=A0A932MNN6_UNCTE|nr:glycosyltransferase family 9 protein [Candidatus Tectomicrobia bacterium]
MRMRFLLARTLRSIPYWIYRAVRLLTRPPQRDLFPSSEMMESVRRILLIKFDALGDILMTSPAIRAIRRRFPVAEIHLLTQTGVAPLARFLPGMDAVESLPCGFLLRGGRRLRRALAWVPASVRLRRARYDLILDFSGLFHSAAAAWIAGAPVRMGFYRHIPLGFFSTDGFGHFYTHEFALDENAHYADRMSRLAAAAGAAPDAGGWRLHLTGDLREAAARLLAENGIGEGGGPLVAVCPGAKWPPKRWSEAGFAGVVDLLQERGWRAVLLAGPDEKDLLDEMRRACRTAPAAVWPPAPLGVLAALLEKADAFLGNDSGPMHMAAAVGTPVIALFGPTPPWRTGPRGSPFIPLYAGLECSPCPLYFTRDRCERGHNYCMDDFRLHDVAAAVELSIERRLPPRRARPAG